MDAKTCSVCDKTVDIYTLIDGNPICPDCVGRWMKGKGPLSKKPGKIHLVSRVIGRGSLEMQKLRFLFPLSIKVYTNRDAAWDDDGEDIEPRKATKYEDQILAAITRENESLESPKGLGQYIWQNDTLKEKVTSLYPSVETINGELTGVMIAWVNEPLTDQEVADLAQYISGQNSDGYGEGFEQFPIKVDGGELYVSFWHPGDYKVRLEQKGE